MMLIWMNTVKSRPSAIIERDYQVRKKHMALQWYASSELSRGASIPSLAQSGHVLAKEVQLSAC